jgi:4-amino-4-deoxy-L-arabinose transferase-like glycosyltransferase
MYNWPNVKITISLSEWNGDEGFSIYYNTGEGASEDICLPLDNWAINHVRDLLFSGYLNKGTFNAIKHLKIDYSGSSIPDDIIINSITVKKPLGVSYVYGFKDNLNFLEAHNGVEIYEKNGDIHFNFTDANSYVLLKNPENIVKGFGGKLLLNSFFVVLCAMTFTIGIGFSPEKYLHAPATYIILTSILARVGYYLLLNDTIYIITPDSSGYIFADGFRSDSRTPVYPVFIALAAMFSGGFNRPELYISVVVLQSLLGVFGVFLLYKSLRLIIKNDKIIIPLSLLYAIQPCVFTFERMIMTESLGIFLTILIVYLLLLYLEKPNRRLALAVGVYPSIWVLERPSFLFIIPVLTVFFILMFTCERKRVSNTPLYGMAGIVISIVVLIGYSGYNYYKYDKFTISTAAQLGQGVNLIAYGIYENDKYPQITEFIQQKLAEDQPNIYEISVLTHEEYGWRDYTSYVSDTRNLHLQKYVKSVIGRSISERNTVVSSYLRLYGSESSTYTTIIQGINRIYFITYGQVFMVAMATLIFGIVRWIRTKTIPWKLFGLSTFILCIMATGLIGYFAIFDRYGIYVLPLIFMLSGIILDGLKISRTNQRTV